MNVRSIFEQYPGLLETLQQNRLKVFLVGGAVRDFLLNKSTRDLDFIVDGDAASLARRIANQLGSAFYILDPERNTARVLLRSNESQKMVLDFARLRGAELKDDLCDRDFTINAIALDLETLQFVDPLRGTSDLLAGILRVCSTGSFSNDPVRVLRAVRFSVYYRLKMLAETRNLLREATALLPAVSGERIRDELFRILQGDQSYIAIRILVQLDVLKYIFHLSRNENLLLPPAAEIRQPWEKALATLKHLELFFDVLVGSRDADASENLLVGSIVLSLGEFRYHLETHFNQPMNPDRSLKALLALSILMAEWIENQTQTAGEDAACAVVKDKIEELGKFLALSVKEIHRVKAIITNRNAYYSISAAGNPPNRREIYHFFRKVNAAGIDICLFCLCEILVAFGLDVDQQVWHTQLSRCKMMFDAWWNHHDSIVDPFPLINGEELMYELALQPSVLVGRLLEEVRAAQAAGEISTPQEAYALARQVLQLSGEDEE